MDNQCLECMMGC